MVSDIFFCCCLSVYLFAFVAFVVFTVSYSVILCFHFGVLSDFAFLFGNLGSLPGELFHYFNNYLLL